MANTNQDQNRWEIFSGPSKFNLVVPPFVEGRETPVSFHCKHNGEPHSRLDVIVSALVVQTSGPDPVEGTTYSYLFWGKLSELHRHNYVSPFVIGSYSPTERTGWLRLITPIAYLAVLATLGSENARAELEREGYKLPQISSPFSEGSHHE